MILLVQEVSGFDLSSDFTEGQLFAPLEVIFGGNLATCA